MMAVLPYALSVHHFVSQVGDYVGFAAIVAVAIMVLLLFAHARETAELRRRAEFAEDELALLHEQVEWLHDAQQPGDAPGAAMPGSGTGDVGVAAVPPPASAAAARGGRTADGTVAGAAALATGAGIAAATSTGSAGTVAAVPAPASAGRGRAVVFGAPVGVGAPALSSATKLIPPTDEELRAVAAASGSSASTDNGAAVAEPPALPVTAPPPATAAAGGNGKPPRRAGVAADPGAAGGGRPGYPAAVTSPRRNYGSGGERSGGRRISRGLIAAITVLVAVIAVVVVILLTGVIGGSSNKNSNQAAASQTSTAGKTKGKAKNATKDKAKGATVKIDPQTVTVAVLNGTTTANLAAAVSDKLSNKGFQQGSTGNAANQTMAATVVGYQPGDQGAKNDAYAVAVALGLKSTAVKPVSTASQSVACSGTPTNCPDQVIVTVGADLNSDAA
jgi:hypothetical protein